MIGWRLIRCMARNTERGTPSRFDDAAVCAAGATGMWRFSLWRTGPLWNSACAAVSDKSTGEEWFGTPAIWRFHAEAERFTGAHARHAYLRQTIVAGVLRAVYSECGRRMNTSFRWMRWRKPKESWRRISLSAHGRPDFVRRLNGRTEQGHLRQVFLMWNLAMRCITARTAIFRAVDLRCGSLLRRPRLGWCTASTWIIETGVCLSRSKRR